MWIDAQETRAFFSMDGKTLRRLAREGVILSAKIGDTRSSRRLYELESIENFLDRQRVIEHAQTAAAVTEDE